MYTNDTILLKLNFIDFSVSNSYKKRLSYIKPEIS